MLIASKMVLLMLTFEFFSLTSLVSLEVGISKVRFFFREIQICCFMNNIDVSVINCDAQNHDSDTL